MYPQLDNDDKTILGTAEDYLRDPRAVKVTANLAGQAFDPKRPAQDWYIPDAVDGLVTLKLARDSKTRAIDFDKPHLVPATIPIEWLSTPNIQDNPNLQGGPKTLLPPPLHELGPDEHLVTQTVGAFLFPQVYVRKGAAPPPKPTTGGGDGVFSAADREFILSSLTEIKLLLNQ